MKLWGKRLMLLFVSCINFLIDSWTALKNLDLHFFKMESIFVFRWALLKLSTFLNSKKFKWKALTLLECLILIKALSNPSKLKFSFVAFFFEISWVFESSVVRLSVEINFGFSMKLCKKSELRQYSFVILLILNIFSFVKDIFIFLSSFGEEVAFWFSYISPFS